MGLYIDEGRSYERGGILYPTQELIKNIVGVRHLSGVPIRFNVPKCELRVAPGLVRGARELTGRCSLEDRGMSGQLIRLELALWGLKHGRPLLVIKHVRGECG